MKTRSVFAEADTAHSSATDGESEDNTEDDEEGLDIEQNSSHHLG